MKIKLFLIIAAVATVFSGCKKEQGSPIFRVTPETLEFEAAGGNQELNVVTTGDWKVSGNSHFKVNPASGNGAGTVTVTAPQSDKDESIVETLTFACGEKTATVKVSQKGKGAPVDDIKIEPSSLTFEAYITDAQEVKVTASGAWEAKSGAEWATATPAEGKAVINVSKNRFSAGGAERSATITFTCGTKSVNLTVKQAAAEGPITKLYDAEDFLDFIASLAKGYSAETTVEFMNDIDFTGKSIGTYAEIPATVTLDGKGFAIKNWDNGGVPMVKTNKGIVQNLKMDSSCTITYDITKGSTTQFGIFCAQNQNLMKNCTNEANINFGTFSVTATTHWGLFAGINRATIEDCVNKGNVTIGTLTGPSSGNFRLGGICGSLAETGTVLLPVVKNCSNEGNFSITYGDTNMALIGGIAGHYDSGTELTQGAALVDGCVNKGVISVSSQKSDDLNIHCGGIAGGFYGGLLTNSKNLGKITSAGSAGGIAGYNQNSSKVKSNFSTMGGCAVNAEISGNAARTGFVFGYINNGTIPFALGTPEAPVKVAGKVNGTAVTAENYNQFLLGSDSTTGECNINAKYEDVK